MKERYGEDLECINNDVLLFALFGPDKEVKGDVDLLFRGKGIDIDYLVERKATVNFASITELLAQVTWTRKLYESTLLAPGRQTKSVVACVSADPRAMEALRSAGIDVLVEAHGLQVRLTFFFRLKVYRGRWLLALTTSIAFPFLLHHF